MNNANLSRFSALPLVVVIGVLLSQVTLAGISLTYSSVSMTQTSDTGWTLTKTGSVDTASSTLTWTMTTTEGATCSEHMVVGDAITVT